ncbi:hypothetical protein CDAR_550561 [Caerostris darwini]|uniref:Uncharacterized protein n=1 Tax=Caerostris darwini TaxID=1538125 RepID=A0AAV4XAR2_9ARAC|nr:hypothetical protein CDAR_550561 [Caerostris darwini]
MQILGISPRRPGKDSQLPQSPGAETRELSKECLGALMLAWRRFTIISEFYDRVSRECKDLSWVTMSSLSCLRGVEHPKNIDFNGHAQ